MPYESAKCPSCGFSFQVDPNANFTVCPSCGINVEPKKAIEEHHIKVSGNVSVGGISTVENDINYGRLSLGVSDWDSALQAFSNASRKDASMFEAWHGCLLALTHNYSILRMTEYNGSGLYNFHSVIHNCFLNAKAQQRETFIAEIDGWKSKISDGIDKYNSMIDENKRQKELLKSKGKTWGKRVLICTVLLLFAALLLLLFGNSDLSFLVKAIIAIPAIVGCLAGIYLYYALIACIYSFHKSFIMDISYDTVMKEMLNTIQREIM
jgi:hypothetical protein